MHARRHILACACALALAAPAWSQEPQAEAAVPPAATVSPPTLSDLGRSLRTYFSEEELALLFEYMRNSVIAAFKGEEVYLPPDITFKLEVLMVRLKKEGGHYMDNLIRQMERDLARSLKEKLKPPPVRDQPYEVPPYPRPLAPPVLPLPAPIPPPPPMLPPGVPLSPGTTAPPAASAAPSAPANAR